MSCIFKAVGRSLTDQLTNLKELTLSLEDKIQVKKDYKIKQTEERVISGVDRKDIGHGNAKGTNGF